MTPTVEKICAACGLEYDWPAVRAGEEDYCCQACARGQPCTCPQHGHGYEWGEPLAPEEVEQVGIIQEPIK